MKYQVKKNNGGNKAMTNQYTIEIFKGVEADVFTYYQPYEPATGSRRTGNPYPGCEEEFYVESVVINGEDVAEFFTEEFLEVILDKVKATFSEPDYD